MPELNQLLDLCKSAAASAGARLLDQFGDEHRKYVHSAEFPKEIKAFADTIVEQDILAQLAAAGLPILSEESGYLAGREDDGYWFIVDPLDGTFNFVKGLGPSAVSIALWKEQTPVFGAIYDLSRRQLIWGGPGLGAFAGDKEIRVSDTHAACAASICTGFPVRFDLSNEHALQQLLQVARSYAKVRMIGSAAMSLVNVAQGSADAYAEQDIMLWDVAAGLAIVEGAGGRTRRTPGSVRYALNVFAYNGILAE
jgi:myo-inositol-1(or 4)-monophosphatase